MWINGPQVGGVWDSSWVIRSISDNWKTSDWHLKWGGQSCGTELLIYGIDTNSRYMLSELSWIEGHPVSTQRLTALVRQNTRTYICAQIWFRNVLSKNSSELVSEVAEVGFTRPTLAHRNPRFGKRKDKTARNEDLWSLNGYLLTWYESKASY